MHSMKMGTCACAINVGWRSIFVALLFVQVSGMCEMYSTLCLLDVITHYDTTIIIHQIFVEQAGGRNIASKILKWNYNETY